MNVILSFPRSGQHITESILRHVVTAHGLEFTYCEFYTCCRTSPCQKGSQFQKSHDENIQLSDENKYLVLYRRDPILQLEAFARHENRRTLNDTVEFMKFYLPWYHNFVEKWCDNETRSNVLVYEYYEFFQDPVCHTKIVFQHFYPTIPLRNEIFDDLLSVTFSTDDGNRNIVQAPIFTPKKMPEEYYQQLQEATGINVPQKEP